MKRLILTTAVMLLASPAGALAASGKDVVLSVDQGHHRIQVVDAGHVVHGYAFRHRLPRLHPGSVISFKRAGSTITRVLSTSNGSQSIVFDASVLRSGPQGIVLRLADGHSVTVAASRIAHRRTARHTARKASLARAADRAISSQAVTVNIENLAPGTVVTITETVGPDGRVTVTITLPVAGEPDEDSQAAIGTITQVSAESLTIATPEGPMTFDLESPELADGFNVGDSVEVTYAENADGTLEATDVEYVEQTASGTVLAVSADSMTIRDDETGEAKILVADPQEEVFAGVSPGDHVEARYHESSGQLIADEVEGIDDDAQ